MSAATNDTPVTAAALVRPSVLRPSIQAEPVSTALGAEVHHVHLGDAAQDPDLIAEVRRLLLKHKVLFFRNQAITPMEHQRFGECFGELHSHPLLDMLPEAPKVLALGRNTGAVQRFADRYSYENAWHLDAHYEETPTMGSILRCVQCPSLGGDTMWANMAMAYERLSDDVKALIADLYARNHHEQVFLSQRPRANRLATAAQSPPVEHPVVYTHPETGEKILYVDIFTTHLCNYYRFPRVRSGQDFVSESNHLLQYLVAQANTPEYHVRLRWKPDTVAFWDNRCTQHYAVHDYGDAPRLMHRVSIRGT